MSETHTPEDALEVWADRGGPYLRPEDFTPVPTFEDGVLGFVRFVATQAAYNGADDRGQFFYDEMLNPWLSEQAERYLRPATERTQ